MSAVNNYLIHVQQAKERFTTYDQNKLITKLKLRHDEDHLYAHMLSERYRIHRKSGDIGRMTDAGWVNTNDYGEVMTLLDLVCDCREDRFITGRWKNLTDFGLMFHRNLLEDQHDPWADRFEADPEGFRRACESFGGKSFPQGDIAYTIELFDGLSVVVQLWFGDEEFPAGLRFLWDENALMYLKYETMHFAKGMMLEKIAQRM